MDNGFSTSDAVLTAAMSGNGFGGNRSGNWGGDGYGYGGQFADASSNAVRIRGSERTNDKGQDFLSKQISDNADRNRDTLRTLEVGNSFERISDKIADQSAFFVSEVNGVQREMAANARDAAKCCCDAKVLAIENQGKTDMAIALIKSNQDADTRVAEAVANAAQNAKLDALLALNNNGS